MAEMTENLTTSQPVRFQGLYLQEANFYQFLKIDNQNTAGKTIFFSQILLHSLKITETILNG